MSLPRPALTPLRTALVALAGVGLCAGLGAAVLVLTSDQADASPVKAVAGLLLGWSYIGVGLYAWDRRPSSRFGAFMTATGLAWFLGAISWSDEEWVFAIGYGLGGLAFGFLTQMVVSFPDGRLRGWGQKGVVLLVWVVVTVFEIGTVPFTTTPSDECELCPANPIQIVHNEALYDALTGLELLLALIALVWLGFVMRDKVRRAPRSQKPIVRNVFVAVACAVGLVLVSGLAELTDVPSGAGEDATDWLSLTAMALVPFTFLLGLMRSRMTAGDAVSELVTRLGEAPRGATGLRAALARALSDPTLELAYHVPGTGYVTGDGAPVEPPAPGSGRSWHPVQREGRDVAALIHDSALDEDPELIESVGAAAALALDNERLDAELRTNLAELRASRTRLVAATDAGRRRLERDIHDGVQQHLVALALSIRMARNAVTARPAQAVELLDEAAAQLDTATTELRELARGIHPAVLSDRGLGPALEALAARAALPVELADRPSERLPASIEAAAYFVVAEALTNAGRYARATAATVSVVRADGHVAVEIADDGVGGADVARGSGLRGLEDRVAALDGTLDVASPPGGGTTVRAVLPCAS